MNRVINISGFGRALRKNRELINIDRATTAAALGICMKTLQRWEDGFQYPNFQNVCLICRLFKMPRPLIK